jgi:predicted PolB exonuclease-like 3'-5' exonuclease
MAGYRATDIETVVDERFWDRPPSRFRPVPGGPRLAVGLEEEEPFPPPQAHRVVAIASVELSGDDGKWYSFEKMSVECGWEYEDGQVDEVEAGMLRRFGEQQAADAATLVTWNGRTFDLPVINLRSFLHRIPCAWYYEERDVRYRYTEAGHCDVMDLFSDFGAARSMKLGDVARLAGLPGKIGDVRGSSVGELYKAYAPGPIGRTVEEIHEVSARPFPTVEEARCAVGNYCLLDALQTAILFARSRVHKGMIEESYYESVVMPTFREPLTSLVGLVRRRGKAA